MTLAPIGLAPPLEGDPLRQAEHLGLIQQFIHSKLPVFVLTEELNKAITWGEMKATIDGLHECDLLHLPYPEFILRMEFLNSKGLLKISEFVINEFEWLPNHLSVGHWPVEHCVDARGSLFIDLPHAKVTTIKTLQDGSITILKEWSLRYEGNYHEIAANHAAYCTALLITALATRNIIKDTQQNKRLNHPTKPPKGLFKGEAGNIIISRTCLRVPSSLENDETSLPGREVCAHLRRGFVNTYHVGQGRTELLKKWIQPVFVNADKEYVARLPRYKVTA